MIDKILCKRIKRQLKESKAELWLKWSAHDGVWQRCQTHFIQGTYTHWYDLMWARTLKGRKEKTEGNKEWVKEREKEERRERGRTDGRKDKKVKEWREDRRNEWVKGEGRKVSGHLFVFIYSLFISFITYFPATLCSAITSFTSPELSYLHPQLALIILHLRPCLDVRRY